MKLHKDLLLPVIHKKMSNKNLEFHKMCTCHDKHRLISLIYSRFYTIIPYVVFRWRVTHSEPLLNVGR